MLKTTSKPRITVDPETGISIIKVSNNPVVESDSRGNCIIDFDEDEQVCRIEVLPFNLPG